MLSNTLSIIETSLRSKLNNNADIPAILDFFKYYRKNMWIYPGVLKRRFSLELSEIYEILVELEKQNVLQSYYELYCSQCQKSMGIVELFNELPDFFECELCHSQLPALENAILIYKVIRDD